MSYRSRASDHEATRSTLPSHPRGAPNEHNAAKFGGSLHAEPLASGYNQSYTAGLKTAISIPDEIFEQAERLAETRGWSRSELYANAVSALVNHERFAGVSDKLDAVYANHADESAVDPLLADVQARSLVEGKW